MRTGPSKRNGNRFFLLHLAGWWGAKYPRSRPPSEGPTTRPLGQRPDAIASCSRRINAGAKAGTITAASRAW
jgi:hypothetical protein